MTIISEHALSDLASENTYAHEKWGNSFDDKNTLNDWLTYSGMYATDAARMDIMDDPEQQYRMLVKAANLLLCAATRVKEDRLPPRHYDEDRSSIPESIDHGKGNPGL